MFGQTEITGGSSKQYPYLPDRALQKYKNESFVFVEQGNGTFAKQKVELGERLGDGYLIEQGVSSGDRIVGSGSFKLKSGIT